MAPKTKRTLLNWGIGLGVAALAGIGARAMLRRSRYMDLCGRNVLITGGSRGLGLDLAREAVARGANVAICSRGQRELDIARADLLSRGGRVVAIQCDVTNPAQVNEMAEAVLTRFGAIDVVINNAGMITVSPMEYVSVEDYQEALRTHFAAPLYATLAVLPSMQQRGSGRIVNIASVGGKIPVPHLVPYCASKAALIGFSESCRAELAQQGIYVTTVVPGLMRTGSARNIDVRGQVEQEYAWFATSDVIPGLSIDPVRMAKRILDAASAGQAELILPLSARCATLLHGLFPGLFCEISALANRLLPTAGHVGDRRATGFQSESCLIPEFARRRNDRAAAEHNEFAAPQSIASSP